MKLLETFGRYVLFLRSMFSRPEKLSMYWREISRQMNNIGIESIPIILVVAAFVGAVTAVQFAYQIKDFPVPTYYIGFIVRDVMIIEMAPTVSCMMLAGKVGSNIASELGNMRISEQIDALEIMGVNTIPYLITTKIIAALITIPCLVILSAFVGILGGLVSMLASDLASLKEFEQGLRAFFLPFNVTLMMIKGTTFAFLLTTIACFEGYFVKGGAIQIGEASTRAVVVSNIVILFFDFLLAYTFL